MTKIIVFLGNPGSQFNGTRHNTGWALCDMLQADGIIPTNWQNKFHALYCKDGETVYLKPQTYMNLSGQSVQEAAKFYNVKAENIIVVHDDIELKFGEVKKQLGGGMGGHNGLRSVKQNLGTDQFQRLRIGVGRPEDSNAHIDVATWVIGHFSDVEKSQMELVLKKAITLL